jgi:sugar phosphate permease
VVVVLMGLLAFVGGTETNPVLGIFQGPMTRELGWSRASFTAPMTMGTILGGLVGLVVGPALDRYGGRWILGSAAVLLGGVFVLMGFVGALWQHFVLQIIGRAVLTGCFFLATGVVVPKWFVQKRGRAIAFSGLGQRAGHTILPVLTERVIALASWRAAWIATGALAWAMTVLPLALFLRRRPEDLGLLPDGAHPAEAGSAKGGEQVLIEEQGAPQPQEVSMRLKEVLRTPAFYLLLAAQSFMSFVAAGVHFHWFSYLQDQGIASGPAVASLAVSALVAMPVSVAAGFAAERFHVRYILAAAHVALAANVAFLAFTSTALEAYIFGVAHGATTGVSFTIGTIVWANYYGRDSVGAVRGAISPVAMLSNALGPFAAALAFDLTGSYGFILGLFTAMSCLAALCMVLAVPPRPRLPRVALPGLERLPPISREA